MKANAGQVRLRHRGRDPDEGRRDLLHDRRARRPSRSSNEVAEKAGAIIAIGSCASWGGIPSADPNPTGATARRWSSRARPSSPSRAARRTPTTSSAPSCSSSRSAPCPRSTTRAGRSSRTARTIHEHCPRRAHFDAGRFVAAVRRRGAPPGLLPLQDGLQGPGDPRQLLDAALRRGRGRVADRPRPPLLRLHRAERSRSACRCTTTVEIERPTPPDTYPPIHAEQGGVSAVATGVAGLAVGALLGAGYRFAKKLGATEPEARRAASDKGVKCHEPGRRRALRVLAGTARPPPPRPRRPRRTAGPRAEAGPARRDRACSTTPRCASAARRASSPASEANDLPARPRPPDGLPHDAPVDLNGKTKNVIKLYKDGRRRVSFVKAQCMHCVDPACAARLHAQLAPEGRDHGHRGVRPGSTASAAATARWRARSTCRSSSSTRRSRRSSSASCAATASGRRSSRRRRLQPLPRATARLLRGLPARGGDLRQARRAPRRGEAPARREPRAPTCRRSTARPTPAGRRSSTCPHVPFEKLGLPDLGPQGGARHRRTRSRTASTRASSRPSPSTASSGRSLWRNRKDRREGRRRP